MTPRFSALSFVGAAAFASSAAAQWGNIAGKVTLDPSLAAPPAATLDVPAAHQDRVYCLGKGPLADEKLVVNPQNRGIKNVFVYLKEIQPGDIHSSYPQDKAAVAIADEAAFLKANGVSWEAVVDAAANGKADVSKLQAHAMIDQVQCVFVPHALFVREGQKLLVKNPEPVSHNTNVQGFEAANCFNQTMQMKSVLVKELVKENGVVSVQCNVHGWMQMHLMVLDHPYCAVTDENGVFALPKVKAGTHKLVVRNCDGLMFERGKAIVVTEGQETAVAVAAKPKAK